MNVTTQRKEAITHITILTKYAPHKGYTATERKTHWGEVEQTIANIPKIHMTIWCTDANGQLGRKNQDPNSKHIIGPYTPWRNRKRKWAKTIPRMQNNLIPTNAWKMPKLTIGEKHDYENTKKRRTPNKNYSNTQTERNHMDKHQQQDRQIDYVMINQRFRNSIRTAQSIPGWKANMHQGEQQNAIYMQICLKLMKNYRKDCNPETGTKCPHNIHDIKPIPERLQQYMGLKQKTYEYDNKTPHQNLQKMETQLQQALVKIYPNKKTQQEKKMIGFYNFNGTMQRKGKQWNTCKKNDTRYKKDQNN